MASGSGAAASTAEEDGADVGAVQVSSKRNAANRRALAHLTQISGGRVQIHKVRHIAMSWQCGRNHRRKGIRAEGTEYCLSDAIGLVVTPSPHFESHVCMTNVAQQYSAFTKLINQFLSDTLDAIVADESASEERRKQASEFRWTTFNINQDLKSLRHRDRNNAGLSAIIALGRFRQGQLRWWPDDTRSVPASQLTEQGSKIVNVKDKLQFFDGRCAHETMEFDGSRTSIIWYAGTFPVGVAHELTQEATQLGFRLPEEMSHTHDSRPVMPTTCGGRSQADGGQVQPQGASVAANDHHPTPDSRRVHWGGATLWTPDQDDVARKGHASCLKKQKITFDRQGKKYSKHGWSSTKPKRGLVDAHGVAIAQHPQLAFRETLKQCSKQRC